jgi:hypothetical protein
MRQKEFISADLYLSSALAILLKTPPTFKVENGRTLFVFQVSNDFYKAMSDYNSGISINALEYSGMLKRLKSEMLMRKSMALEGR